MGKSCYSGANRSMDDKHFAFISDVVQAAQVGCMVDSLTLSVEQKTLAEERVRKAGFESQVRIHLMDYRKMPPDFEKAFDACIALEMIEVCSHQSAVHALTFLGQAVGVEYMPTFIKTVDWALKDRNAAVVLSATCYPDTTFTSYQYECFFVSFFAHFLLQEATISSVNTIGLTPYLPVLPGLPTSFTQFFEVGFLLIAARIMLRVSHDIPQVIYL